MTIKIGQTFTSNNGFSDTITVKIVQELQDGTYLVHKHTECSDEYRDEHPDGFFVVTSAMLENGDLDFVRMTQSGLDRMLEEAASAGK